MTHARKDIQPHRCFYTWDIHYACNYRCSYCFFHETWEEEKKKNRYPGLEKLKMIWGNIYEKYGEGHLHISGGEPFAYPDIIALTSFLTRYFTVEFDTNLSFDVKDFMNKVSPEKVKFATAFHPQFEDFNVYLEKVKLLKSAGYDLGVNYVAFPEQLAKMNSYKERLNEFHISFDIMPFRGKYKQLEYPNSYTEEQKKLICECDPKTAARMLGAYSKPEKKPAENAVQSSCPNNPHYGKPCRMGQMYTKIHANGNAYRCCLIKEPGLLGNIIDGTFAFYEEPKLCEYDKCPCWVAMIVGSEENWLFHWVTPKINRAQ